MFFDCGRFDLFFIGDWGRFDLYLAIFGVAGDIKNCIRQTIFISPLVDRVWGSLDETHVLELIQQYPRVALVYAQPPGDIFNVPGKGALAILRKAMDEGKGYLLSG